MTNVRFALIITTFGVLLPANLGAQVTDPAPSMIDFAALEVNNELDLSSDLVLATCDKNCGNSDCSKCGLADRGLWKLPQPCTLQSRGISVGGWLEAGATFNDSSPADNYNGPILGNDRHNELQMNQLWVYMNKPVDTGGCGIDIGGRADLFYGTDWRIAQYHGFGLEDRINRGNSLYGLSAPQFYMEVGVNDFSIKMGRMTGILDYEIIPPVGNFFYSHSYAFSYDKPLLITGAMAKYPVSERLTLLAGFHQGTHRFEDNNGELNFQGGATWKSCNGKSSIAYAVDLGRNDVLNAEPEQIHNLILKHQVTEKLLYVIQGDVGLRENVATLGGRDAEWYGITQYLLYTMNPCWSAGARVEWFRDDDGAVVLGLNNLPQGRGWAGAPGYAGAFNEITLGLNYTPNSSISIRPEVRWDWYDGAANGAGPYPFPYDVGNSDDQFTFGVDLLYTF